MIELTLRKLLEIIKGQIIQGNINRTVQNVITDLTKFNSNEQTLYFELRPSNETELEMAESSKLIIVTERPERLIGIQNSGLIKVDSIDKSYWEFIEFYRGLFDIPVLGVTGTCGKTTTIEMIKTILSPDIEIQSTRPGKNALKLNLPYLLGINTKTEAGVFEMGVTHPGNISTSCRYFRPNIGILLNIGVYHLEGCKTLDNYIEAKKEMITGVDQKGYLILNADDQIVGSLDTSLFKGKIIYFGRDKKAHFRAEKIDYSDGGMNFTLVFEERKRMLHVPGFGIHNVYNALAALAAAFILGVNPDEAGKRLALFKPVAQHLQFSKGMNGCSVIDDTWNNSPPSMEAALQVLKDTANSRKTIAVLGEMPQLKDLGKEEYIKIGEKAIELGIDYLILVGEAAIIGQKALELGMKPDRVWFPVDADDLFSILEPLLDNSSLLLLKLPFRLIRKEPYRGLVSRIKA